jgi:hypothetical protein
MKRMSIWLGVALALAPVSPAVAQPAPNATTVVQFRNDLPGSFELERVRLWVDGAVRTDTAGPFVATLDPGDHLLSLTAEYRLRDPLLPYVRSYRTVLRSEDHVPAATANRLIRARAVEVGGVTTPVERRAQILWR